jgi:hypothetical protein
MAPGSERADKILVENVNHPGKTERVDAEKYAAMREAMLAALPKGMPGITADELRGAVRPNLPGDLFPGGKTSGWWVKCVQLDLEAKGIVAREKVSPIRLFRT